MKFDTMQTVVAMHYEGELSEMQNNELIRTLFNIKRATAWLCDETESKYQSSTGFARKLLLSFLPSYLVECGLNAVNDLLLKKEVIWIS